MPCVASIRVCMQIHRKCSQEIHGLLQLIMITHCLVCGGILPTLYIAVTIVTVRQKWEVDHCQGLMVGVKIICSSMGSGYIVQWIAGGQEVKLGFVNLLSVFMVAVWAVFLTLHLSVRCLGSVSFVLKIACCLYIKRWGEGGNLALLCFTEYWYFTMVVS